ncbi:hypothetical protein QBC46DRAFT_343728 [Diplogelasinospora grovesii]|uniref:Uncharacterized protein n=1 Tax=Diplogelasinospora grovesii TaxID=303347 RepID=A0AAN6N6H3_9PEZI|nr:hypothetical protein QBC46DRAFT_343728 [Diplogelasinospora grovesii]
MNPHPATSALMHPQSLRQIHNETSSFSAATYALHAAISVEQQNPQMVSF